MLDLVRRLINALNKNDIKYCHWKSNINLGKAVSGYDDLDLLVSKKDVSRFKSVILSLDFKSAYNTFISFPSIEHYYGCDLATGEIVHLHIYYKIISGPGLTKSYVFNIENAILSDLVFSTPSAMPVPQHHVELIIYIIRTMTAFSFLFEHILTSRHFDEVHREINYLYNELDDNKIKSFLHIHFPLIEFDFLKECITAIIEHKHSTLFLLGNKLRRKIKKYRRLSRCNELIRLFIQLLYRILNRLLFHQKKRFDKGGSMIAIVGADATGKTTITNALCKWLGENFTTHLIHAGKPPSTLLTFPLNLSIKVIKMVKGKRGHSHVPNNRSLSILTAIRLLTLAYDRNRLIRRFWQKSINGDIVICDRYPSVDIGVMDSQRMQQTDLKGFRKILACHEQKYYESIPKADVVLQLQVPVEIAVERNDHRDKADKENEAFIRLRHMQNHNLNYKAELLHSIDTSGKYDEVIIQIKRLLWKNL